MSAYKGRLLTVGAHNCSLVLNLLRQSGVTDHKGHYRDIHRFIERYRIMAFKIEKLPIPQLMVGEGPHWDTGTQSLYLVDVPNSTVYRYCPSDNEYFSLKLGIPMVSFIIPVSGSEECFLLASDKNIYMLSWNGISNNVQSLKVIYKLQNVPSMSRINDGKCDPTGRLWFGSMKYSDYFGEKICSLYSYTKEEGCKLHLKEIGISNGLTWDADRNIMYYIDSVSHTVDALDYKTEGIIENRRVIFDLKQNGMEFFADGMTIDSEGEIWVACFQGYCILHINPKTGVLVNKITMPAKNVTSLAWGGQNFDDLYVTTAAMEGDNPNDEAGFVYKISGLSRKGLPMVGVKF